MVYEKKCVTTRCGVTCGLVWSGVVGVEWCGVVWCVECRVTVVWSGDVNMWWSVLC